MKNLWDKNAREELSERISMLTPDASPRWGKLTARGMMAHLVDVLRMAIGEIKVADKKHPLRYAPLKQLVIYGPPFPKNAPTSPELIVRQAEDWDGECEKLRQTMDAFAARPPTRRLPNHPIFGKLSHRTWGALSYKHIDHHLKQFGV